MASVAVPHHFSPTLHGRSWRYLGRELAIILGAIFAYFFVRAITEG